MIQIAVLNESSAIDDAEVQAMLPAFEQQWNGDLDPIWGVGAAGFKFIRKSDKPASGASGWSFWTTAIKPTHSPTMI